MEGTMAVITPVAYDFTPRYWMQCNGQLLSIATNSALFSLLGTTFGGNGIQTFGIPDLRGRVPVGTGNSVSLGEKTGTETTTMTIGNMPSHNHNGVINITPRVGAVAETGNVSDMYPGQAANGYANTATANTFTQAPNVVSTVIGTAGGSYPFSVLTPYLALNYVICVQGIYPSRN
jgi:microcystin-dependent protein